MQTFFLVERADYGCHCSWRQCHNVWRQISLHIGPIMCWINGGGGQTCITAAAAAQLSPRDPYQTVYPEIINKSSETHKSSLLSIYWVPFKSNGKPCQCSLGVVMQSLRGHRHSCRATRMQQWSTSVPCHVSMLVPRGYCNKKKEFRQTCFLWGVEKNVQYVYVQKKAERAQQAQTQSFVDHTKTFQYALTQFNCWLYCNKAATTGYISC